MKDNNSEKPKPVRKIPAKRITPKPPKFNFMWVYALVIAVFIGVAVFSGNTGGRAIDFKKFETEMLKQGDVKNIVAYKSGDLVVAEVYIKKRSTQR
jgi:cell division protease FtsH